ncbi:hypothetical protein OHB26_39255 (plasmid) [Nocardia sp. NBC_01503]|nr:hypothetical protein [Nocardia sp. NBC_01503]WTL36717.1 hypothetical protein OHB26_39255 [Nocardia sp. NBC_01503]
MPNIEAPVAVAGIAHLEFEYTPPCEGAHPEQNTPAAQYRCDQHGCEVFLFCADCERTQRELLEHALTCGGVILCNKCARLFGTFAESVQITPLHTVRTGEH